MYFPIITPPCFYDNPFPEMCQLWVLYPTRVYTKSYGCDLRFIGGVAFSLSRSIERINSQENTATPVAILCPIHYNHGKGDDRMKIFHNAVVYTGDDLTHAFAVEDGRFLAVGDEALALAGERIDLGGAFVCAGFNDSHMHLLSFGQALSMAPLAEHTASLEDMVDCLKKTRPDRGWILGRGWNQDYFSDVRRMPSRHDLDRVSAEHPVCANRACGHALVVNSKALELLGITPDTPSPEGGEIDFENGRFFDNAMDLVLNAIPAPDKQTLKRYIRTACAELNRRGITSCHSDDYSVFRAIPWQTVNEVYRELEAAGELTVRVREQANLTTLPELLEFIETSHPATDRFSMGPLKLLGDGALGARTAFLSRPYADAPGTRGLSVFTGQQFDELIGCAHRSGMQVAVHCIGDACLDLVLNAIEKAQTANPRTDARHGIVHCQITRPDQLERIARMKLHVYAQSIFLDYDTRIIHQRVGAELAASSYSWKTLLDTGATVSNGSDCPVEAPDVLAGIQCAVTRSDLSGCAPYLPREAFSVREALDSFTKAGAYASFEENIKGAIQPGMLADFVILGKNPFQASPDELKDIPILQTWLDGARVL